MKNFHLYSLLLVGNSEDKQYLQKFFNEIFLVKSNKNAFIEYQKRNVSIIFLSCAGVSEDSIEIARKIRKLNRKIIIVLVLEKALKEEFLKEELFNALSLHLSGYIEKPFKLEKIKMLFEDISNDLELFYKHQVNLKENYEFNMNSSILYDTNKVEVKLTKNEMKLMLMLAKSKEPYVNSEVLEHSIWEAESAHEDCNKRLKYLIYGLRKKLPQKSILNSYTLGYKLVIS